MIYQFLFKFRHLRKTKSKMLKRTHMYRKLLRGSMHYFAVSVTTNIFLLFCPFFLLFSLWRVFLSLFFGIFSIESIKPHLPHNTIFILSTVSHWKFWWVNFWWNYYVLVYNTYVNRLKQMISIFKCLFEMKNMWLYFVCVCVCHL